MEEDPDLRRLLESVRTIAVVGMKDGDADEAFRVPRYMQQQGYRIVPVNPKLETVLGERSYTSLAEIPEPVDLVNLFRAPAFRGASKTRGWHPRLEDCRWGRWS